MASRKDLAPKDIVFRTELEILGALEAWFSEEGIAPSDENRISPAGKQVRAFQQQRVSILAEV
jgi:hypothetical protein